MDPRVPNYAELEESLRLLDYSPVPIAPGTKAPPRRCHGWQDPAKRWSHYVNLRSYTGLLTYNTPAIDLDVRNKSIVEHLIRLADDMIGRTPTRVGASPKTLMMYQAAELFNKVTSRPFTIPQDNEPINVDPNWAPHRIEILANGQQFVSYAVHPGTGEPYRWGRGEPLDVPRSALPALTLAGAREWLATAEHLLEDELGAVFIIRRRGEWILDEMPVGAKRETNWSTASLGRGNPAFWWCYADMLEDVTTVATLRETRRGSWVGRCPVHGSYSGKPPERSDVFQLRVGEDEVLIFKCFAGCDPSEIAEEINDLLVQHIAEQIANDLPDYDYGDHSGMGAEDTTW